MVSECVRAGWPVTHLRLSRSSVKHADRPALVASVKLRNGLRFHSLPVDFVS